MASIDLGFSSEIFRKDHAIIISSNRQLASILGVRLAYDAAGYAAGVVLARNTTSGQYQKYNDAGSSGINTARAVLLHDVKAVDFASTGDVQAAQALFGGEVFKDKLTGLDSAGEVDLGAKTITLPGSVSILKF